VNNVLEKAIPTLPGLHLRRASMSDVPALSRLIERSSRELNVPDYSPAQIESGLRYLFGVKPVLIQDGTYLIAQIGAQIVGCGGWSRRRALYGYDQNAEPSKDADDRLDPTVEAARIRAMFVHPEWARCGIGRALLAASEESARRAGFRRVELVATHTGMPLYRAGGYRIIEPVRVVLPDGEVLTGTRMSKTFA
jgi:GNAT superfamily N-acetyltransferase